MAQLQQIAEKHGVSTKNIICVGDGANEKRIFEISKGVTFRNSMIEDLAWKVVENLKEIPSLINGADKLY